MNHQPANQPPTPKIAPELLIDFDFFAVKAIDGDLHRGWKQLHAGPDIFYTPRNGEHWVYTRAEDIAAAWHAPERYSNSGVAMTREEREMKLYPGEADPPEHTHYRALLMPFFSQKAVQRLEDRMRELTRELIWVSAPAFTVVSARSSRAWNCGSCCRSGCPAFRSFVLPMRRAWFSSRVASIRFTTCP